MKYNKLFTYENQGPNTYLIYEIGEEDSIDSISLGMLTNNTINGFLPITFTQMNTSKYLKYNISAKVSAKKILADKMNKKQMIHLFSSVIDALYSAEEYMIDQNLILFDPEYMFVDLITYETKVVCLPISNQETNCNDIQKFFKDIIFSAQFDFSENTDYVAKIMNFLNGNNSFSLVAFKSLLDELSVENKKKPTPVPAKVEYQERKPVEPVKPVKQPEVVQPVKPVQPVIPEKMEEMKPEVEEKQISLFYLLQHYNKDNAAMYKAQKAEKKKAGKKERTREDDLDILFGHKEKKKDEVKGMDFAIPGQEFAVPGQDFAIPGQENMYMKQVEPVKQNNYFQVEQNIMQSDYIEAPAGKLMDFGETVLLENEETEGTVYLDTEMVNNNYPYLVKTTSKEKIEINKDIFKIGKDASYADYSIKSPVISHKHACIIKRGDIFYIIDTNSKNHTYINGSKIQSNTEVKLEHEMKICFANEEFEFRLF